MSPLRKVWGRVLWASSPNDPAYLEMNVAITEAEETIDRLKELNAILMGDDEDKPRYTTKRLKQEIAKATENLTRERDEARQGNYRLHPNASTWEEIHQFWKVKALAAERERDEARAAVNKALKHLKNAQAIDDAILALKGDKP